MSTSKISRICLWGGPGAGKSTVASYLFSQLKIANYLVEFVPEYVKSWAYAKREAKGFNQVYIFGKQLYAEYSVLESVPHIVCECPVMMNVAYCSIQNCDCMSALLDIAQKFEIAYPSLNIFLDRYTGTYQQWGRYQTYKEALQVDQHLLAFLHNTLTPFVRIPSDCPEQILEQAVSALKSTTCENN